MGWHQPSRRGHLLDKSHRQDPDKEPLRCLYKSPKSLQRELVQGRTHNFRLGRVQRLLIALFCLLSLSSTGRNRVFGFADTVRDNIPQQASQNEGCPMCVPGATLSSLTKWQWVPRASH
jgi:hypothetical protein